MLRRFAPIICLLTVTASAQEVDDDGENTHQVGEIQQPQPMTELEELTDLLEKVEAEDEAAEDGADPGCEPDDNDPERCAQIEDTGIPPVPFIDPEETSTPSRDDDEEAEGGREG